MKYQLGQIKVSIENNKVMWSDTWQRLYYLEKAGYFTHSFIRGCYGSIEYHPTEMFYNFAEEI